MDSDDNSNTTVDILVPTDIDGIPLTWKDGNYATIPGLLDEINKYVIRKALLQPFLKHGVSPALNARTAVRIA